MGESYPEGFKRIYVEKAPVQLTPELYAKLLEDGYIPEEFRERFWAITSPTQAMVYLDEEYMARWKARVRFILLLAFQLLNPFRITHEDVIQLENIRHYNEMLLLRGKNGFERSILVGRVETTQAQPEKRGFLSRLFGFGR